MVKKLISRSEFARQAGVSPAAVTKALRTILKSAADGKRIDVSHSCAVKYLQDKAAAQTESPATGIDPLYEAAVKFCQQNKRISTTALQRELKIGYVRAKRITDTMAVNGVVIGMIPAPPRADTGHTAKNNTKKSESLSNLNSDVDQGRTIHEIPEDIKTFVDMTLRELIQRFGTDAAFLDWLKATKEIENINEKRLKNATTRGELVSRALVKVGVIEPFDTAFNKLLTDGAKTIARRVCAMNGAGRSVEDCEKFVADQVSSFIKPTKAKIARALKNV